MRMEKITLGGLIYTVYEDGLALLPSKWSTSLYPLGLGTNKIATIL